MDPSDAVMPVECLSSGAWAEVADVTGAPAWVGRMAELGLRVGSRIRVIRGGSPCLLQVGGARMSLRGDPGTSIWVRTLPLAS